MSLESDLERGRALDAADELAGFRQEFAFAEPDLVYMDGNSLGRLPLACVAQVQEVTARDWGRRLIRSWNEGWFDAPRRIGEQIAGLLGAGPGQTLVSDATSVNLFKLVMAALALRPGRDVIVSDTLNFPSDLYVIQGCIRLSGNRHTLRLAPSADGIAPDVGALAAAIDERTALVTLSHVAFKSGYCYDAAEVTAAAHRAGALVLWDLSHSAGVAPVELDRWGADMAVGCTYKYLNGGPGAPAFLYVRRELQDEALSPIWGWWGQQSPFEFGLDYRPAPGMARFLSGTAPVLSLLALEPAVAIVARAGMERIRAKSERLTAYLVELVDAHLAPLGFSLGSPRDPARRGGHVSIRHADAWRLNRCLIEEMAVLPDFREPDNIRLGLPPLYTRFVDVWEAVARIRQAVAEGRHLKHSATRAAVT